MWKMKATKIIHDYECDEGNLICVCMFLNFWNENKNAMPITNKDEEKKNMRKAKRKWKPQNPTPPPPNKP